MQANKIMLKIVVVSILAASFPLLAQEPKPTCNHCPATYIPKSELDAYTKRAIENKLVDQQVRSMDIGKAQIGIGMVTRGKMNLGSTSGDAVAEHDQISEVYYIIEGSATFLTGPDLVGVKQRPSTLKTVREQNGPGFGAISVLPCRLVATALLARDCAAVVPFDRSGHHPAVLPWADGDTAWADADGDI